MTTDPRCVITDDDPLVQAARRYIAAQRALLDSATNRLFEAASHPDAIDEAREMGHTPREEGHE